MPASKRPSTPQPRGGLYRAIDTTAASATGQGSPKPPSGRSVGLSGQLILHKERPHPGAQLRFTDADGMQVTEFITDTAPSVIPGQLAGPELRHRQHARVEDRIRELKAAGLTNLPCRRLTPMPRGRKSS